MILLPSPPPCEFSPWRLCFLGCSRSSASSLLSSPTTVSVQETTSQPTSPQELEAATETAPSYDAPTQLLAISDGARDAITLEWSGGPGGRERLAVPGGCLQRRGSRQGPWSAWSDVAAGPSSYRVRGLQHDTAYSFEVRAVVSGIAGPQSNTVRANTQPEHGPAQIGRDAVVEGDGETEWRIFDVGWVFTLPDGMRVEARGGGVLEGGSVASVGILDVATNSYLMFDPVTGAEESRYIETAAGAKDAGALFDQIVASVAMR